MLKSKKFWIVIILTGAAAAFLVAYLMYNKPHPDYSAMKPEFQVPVSEIYAEYVQDYSLANERYTGKVIEVHGELHSVEELDTTLLAVFVVEEGMFGDQGVRCTFDPAHLPDEGLLQPGNLLAIKGYCTGFNEVDVILEKCILIQ